MLRNFKHLINVPVEYFDILISDIEALGVEMVKDISRYANQGDHDLNKEQRPIFRKKIRLLIENTIRNTSFYENAIEGKSSVAIQEFPRFLSYAVEYHFRDGIPLSDEQIELSYHLIIEKYPELRDKFVAVFEQPFPNKNTNKSHELRHEREELASYLPQLAMAGFSITELSKSIREKYGEERVTLAGRFMFKAFCLTAIDDCLELATQNPV